MMVPAHSIYLVFGLTRPFHRFRGKTTFRKNALLAIDNSGFVRCVTV